MKKILVIIGGILVSLAVIIAALFVYTFRDSFTKLPTVSYQYGPQTYDNWDDVFADPSRIEVIPYFTGILETEDRYPELSAQVTDRKDGFDVMGYFVRSAEHGDLLVDAGFDSSFYKNPPFGNYPSHIQWVLRLMKMDKAAFYENENIEFYLEKYRIKPASLFLTHLHIDHTPGAPALPDDTPVIFGDKELNFISTTTAKAHFKNKKDLKTLDFSGAKQMPVIGKAIDIFSDGSFWAISTPGHTKSHISYLINSTTGPVFITGDAVFFENGLKHNLTSHSFDEDKEVSKVTRQKIKKFLAAYPGIKVYYGHDYPD